MLVELSNFLECGAIISSSPGRVFLGWGKRVWNAQADGTASLAFYFPDFFLTDPYSWFSHEHVQEFEIEDLLRLINGGTRPDFQWENHGENLFAWAFNDLQSHFGNGRLQKGVPFVFETAKGVPSPGNLHYLLKNALDYSIRNPVYIYGFWDSINGILGATPEILFKYKAGISKGSLHTVACAGTGPKSDGDKLIKDPKQLHEHNLVVEGIVDSLANFGQTSCGKTELLQLPTLCHLVTPITLTPEQSLEVEQIVAALHPTPALGAYPKEQGKLWLSSYQSKIERKRFGAPAGYKLADGASTCYVAIRNAQWFEGSIHIGAGCGIVPQSRIKNEWKEIQLKMQSIKNILGL